MNTIKGIGYFILACIIAFLFFLVSAIGAAVLFPLAICVGLIFSVALYKEYSELDS